jgi:hypothetical protein
VRTAHADNNGGTFLYDAIYTAIQLLHPEKGLKTIVVLTDGDDSGSEMSMEHIIAAASGHNHIIYTIGLGKDVDREILTKIAESTGGHFYRATTPDTLKAIYQQISAVMHSYYVLTYRSQAIFGRGINLVFVKVTYGNASSHDSRPLQRE